MADEDDEVEEEPEEAPDKADKADEADEPDEADGDTDFDDDEDEDGDGEKKPSKMSKRVKLFLIIGGVVLLLVGGGVGAFFSGILDPYLGFEEEAEAEEGAVVQGQHFFKLDDITLNLNEEGRKSRFLKVGLTLVLVNESDIGLVELMQPRITDYVSTYLRELRPGEMSGSANFYRIRENLLLRVRVAVSPIQVTNVLFDSVLVQ